MLTRAATQAQETNKLPPVALPEVTVEHPQNPEHGDYASSLPMKLARAAGVNPITIAEMIVGLIEPLPEVESIAIERAKKLFGAKFANVQTHSGANANIAMYMALLSPGDTVLGMDLSHGGHLTHGHPVTYITKFFNFVRYKMSNIETGEIDYDEKYDYKVQRKKR